MNKYRFIIADGEVVDIVHNGTGITITTEDVLVTDIETAKNMLIAIGVDISKILQFEDSLI